MYTLKECVSRFFPCYLYVRLINHSTDILHSFMSGCVCYVSLAKVSLNEWLCEKWVCSNQRQNRWVDCVQNGPLSTQTICSGNLECRWAKHL